jgi:L-lactate dehydrogenase
MSREEGFPMPATAIKISVIGAGFVGSAIAYTLVMKGVASDIVLVDINQARAEGEAMDIAHGAPFAKITSIRAGGYEETANSDLVIITAGTNQKPGETRLDLIARNSKIVQEASLEVAKYSPQGTILVVANPVDAMTYTAQKATGLPPSQVIGSGTVLDSSRFRFLLSQHFGQIDPRNIHGYILGEHGDSEFPAWSLANIAGMDIHEAARVMNVALDEEVKADLARQVREAAYEIIARKHATFYGIGMAATRISEAIIRDEHSIMTVSVLLDGLYDVNGVYLSAPAVLGQHGVEKILSPKLTAHEMTALHNSAGILKQAQDSLDL